MFFLFSAAFCDQKFFSFKAQFIDIYAANDSTTNAIEEITIKPVPHQSFDSEEKAVPRIVGGFKAIKGQFRGIVSVERLLFENLPTR